MTVYSKITGTGSYLPAKRVTNDQLAAQLAEQGIETSDEWIVTRSGISSRHYAAADENASDLAVNAARNALAAAGKAPAKPAKAPKAAKGDAPTDDTVPAVLAPNEAVLNDQAAELLGRPVIDLLNALGTMRRQLSGAGVGMPPALSAQRQAADAAAAGAGAGTLLPSVTET